MIYAACFFSTLAFHKCVPDTFGRSKELLIIIYQSFSPDIQFSLCNPSLRMASTAPCQDMFHDFQQSLPSLGEERQLQLNYTRLSSMTDNTVKAP